MFNFPKNIWILLVSQPLAMCIAPALILIGGILGSRIAPDPRLATLPLAVMIIGTASSILIAVWSSKRWGRKHATYMGMSAALAGCLFAAGAALWANFNLLLLAAALMGVSNAFMQQLRFAAMESVPIEDVPRALSVLMLAGVGAAFLGPEVSVVFKDSIASEHGFVGSFLAIAALIVLAMLVFSGFENPTMPHDEAQGDARPLPALLKQPIFVIALLAGSIGFGVMSFVMTAAPISMHEMNGHSLNDTKWVIQSHIAAMFLPSLLTGYLLKRIGIPNVLMLGTAIYALMVVAGLSGQSVMHYWWSMVLLGIGWNFLFLGGTALLPYTYRSCERFKMQAVNDLGVFAVQAAASLSAGWLIFASDWDSLLWASLSLVVLMHMAAFYLYGQRLQSSTETEKS